MFTIKYYSKVHEMYGMDTYLDDFSFLDTYTS